MGLTIFTEDVNNGTLYEFTWLVGQQKPNICRFTETFILRIEADGEEALHIKCEFNNIPSKCSASHKQIWKQPFADFIYDNL